MKKLMTMVCLMATLTMTLTGCGQTKDLVAADLKTADVEKYVTLPETYTGMEVTVAAKQAVTDADVTYYIQNKMEEQQALYITTGTVEDGNVVNIDYSGTLNGEAFDGGTATGQLLEIGSNSFIDGFESGLIGVAVGDTVDLNVTFPENYTEATLAGQAVVFTVTVNHILPALSDENVNIVDADYTEAAAYEDAVKVMLENYVDYQYDYSVKSAIASDLIAKCTFKEIPQTLIDDYDADLRVSLESAAANNGMDLNTYMANRYYVSEDAVDTTIASMAEQCAKEGLTLQAIANKEELNVSDEDLDTQLQETAAAAGFDTVEEYLGETGDTEDFRMNMMYDNVYNFLQESAVVTEN